MSGRELTPECQHGFHSLCRPGDIRREGALANEVPIMTIRCDCPCHRPDKG